MSQSKYKYDFPEQKKLKKGLNYSDIPMIAGNTGYKLNTIQKMLRGERKMPANVELQCRQFAHINAQKDLLKIA